MKNILVVNVNWLGDVVFSTPVFRAIKEKYPQARVSCLAVPRVASILEHVPFIDEVIVYDEKGRDRFLFGKIRIIRELRKRHFELALLLHGSWTRALLAFLAGIPVRVGYDTKKRDWLLTKHLKVPQELTHRSDFYLNVAKFAGFPIRNRETFLKIKDESEKAVERLLSEAGINENDFVVVMHVGGNWNLKQWPIENFAKLNDRLVQEFGAKVIICGGKSDIILAEKLAALAAYRPIIFAGKTNFSELISLMKKANLVISADSGPLHVASSVGTAVIGLFGPTHPAVTGPRGSGKSFVVRHEVGCNAVPCYFLACPDNICMKAIGVHDVVSKVKEIKH